MRLLILSFFVSLAASAQDKPEPVSHSWDVGSDITKLLPFAQEKGVMIEPFVYGPLTKEFRWRAAGGFSDVNFGKVYSNIRYRNKGFYAKAGMSSKIFDQLEFSLNAVYSNFDEIGNVEFYGPVFGNLLINPIQKQTLLGLEFQGDFFLEIYKHWWLDFQYRIGAIFSDFNNEHFSPYFAPGFGELQIGKKDSYLKAVPNSMTVGVSIRAVYRL